MLTKRRMSLTRNMPLLVVKPFWAPNNDLSSNYAWQEKLLLPMQKQWMRHNMVILHASQLEPSRLLQTLSLWVLPPIALKTRPLETMKVTATDAIVVPAQEAALVNVMIAGTTNKSQSLVIAWAKIIILTLVTNLGPHLVGLKTQTMTATIISTTMTPGDRSRNVSPLLSLDQSKNVQCPLWSQIYFSPSVYCAHCIKDSHNWR